MHLAAVGRADKAPECLHIGTAEGLILRYSLAITGAKIGAASKVISNTKKHFLGFLTVEFKFEFN